METSTTPQVRVWTDTPHEQQSKAVAEVASQLQGLLEGSRQVNPKKNPTKAPCLARAAELLGAVEAAVTQLAAAVRGELIAAVTVSDKVRGWDGMVVCVLWFLCYLHGVCQLLWVCIHTSTCTHKHMHTQSFTCIYNAS